MKTKRTRTMGAWVSGIAVVTLLGASPTVAQTYRLASHRAIDGFEKVQLTNGSAVYLGDAVEGVAKSCDALDKNRGHVCSTTALTVSDGSAARIAVSVQRTGANLIAVGANNLLVELSEIESIGFGAITLRNTRRVRQVDGVGTALFSLRAGSATVTAGDAVSVDVFVSGVNQLRTFQVAVEATGGTSGSLDRVEASVDRERADYVFATTQAIDAADQHHGRIGATTMGGSVSAQDTRYLGTFAFVASGDASGTFNFVVRPQLSFLSDADVQDITYRTSTSAVRVANQKTARTIR